MPHGRGHGARSSDLFDRPSTIDDGQRNALDYYETPAWMVASLLAHHPIDRSAVILEPCCGDGAIARALGAAGFTSILTNDLDPRHPATFHRDARLALWFEPQLAAVEWVITNPPFDAAIWILDQAVLLAKVGVAMLLRKTFREPTRDRGPWLATHPPTHEIGLPRHKFRRDAKGTDSVSADWMIWRRGSPEDLYQLAPPFVIDHEAKTRTVAPLFSSEASA